MAELVTLGDIERTLLSDRPRRRFIIPGVLPAGPCLLFGKSGSGKTGLSVRTAVAISAGLKWAGADVTRGCALYVAGEDNNGVQERMVAAARYLDLTPSDLPLAVMEPHGAGLVTLDCRNDIELAAKKLQKETGLPVALVVIDTLAACFGDKSQDDAAAASLYMNNADKLARNLGCAVLSIHHTGKQEGSGMRGSQVFEDRADAVIKVKRGKGNTSFIEVDKLRNGRGGARFAFDIDGFDLPVFDGTISVQVVRQLNALEAIEHESREEVKAKGIQNDATMALGLLHSIAVGFKASRSGWQASCYEAWSNKTSNDARKNAFSKAVKKLSAEGKIAIVGDTVTVTVTENSVTNRGYDASPEDVTVTVTASPFKGRRGDGRYRPDHPFQKQEVTNVVGDGTAANESIAKANAFARGKGGETPTEDYCGDGYGSTGTEG
ncbi:helicase RepA family protein [Rhizobiaceae bacterium n13]|uniref:AAA family ATPase n=1 Tax=Ferirhizobium litorale TaxID=2927786 RepID=UPI0024B2CC9B|nr:AAA family ATPase [Fererhizobium litorale]MDI7865057.1 helicase RepA family protein [Fererhizobium litorale]